jgi:hypothetical protein|nr:SGNH/GDSL hydrolase family protein [uncultured Capnocytophaga sp.]
MKKRILCIGDSTSLPGHTNTFEDTWYYKLSEEFSNYKFITVFRRAITTDILVKEGGGDSIDNQPSGADCLEFYKPSLIIIQLGIVDCAPRLLTNFDKIILKLLSSKYHNAYVRLIKKVRKRNKKNTQVSISNFQKNLLNYIERSLLIGVEKIIFIAIPFPDNRMIKKNPLIEENVSIYNKIIEDLSKKYKFIEVITPLDSRKYNDVIFEDGYHPNPLGNNIVFNALREHIYVEKSI